MVQCKEIEETNRMGNTRVLFKKIRDTKRTSWGMAPQFSNGGMAPSHCEHSWKTVSRGDLFFSSHAASQGGPAQLPLQTKTFKYSSTGTASQLQQIHPSCNALKTVLVSWTETPGKFWFLPVLNIIYQLFLQFCEYPTSFPNKTKENKVILLS